MTDTKLRELLVVIDDHYGRARSLEERRADTQIYIRAFGAIPDEIVEKALYTAFTQCRFQNQLIVDWCAEIKKLLSAQQPSANDLWAQAAAAARKIEANLYYQTHGGFIAPDGRKLKGEDFKKENAKIFAALPMVVQRWAGSPADLSEIFSSRSSAASAFSSGSRNQKYCRVRLWQMLVSVFPQTVIVFPGAQPCALQGGSIAYCRSLGGGSASAGLWTQ